MFRILECDDTKISFWDFLTFVMARVWHYFIWILPVLDAGLPLNEPKLFGAPHFELDSISSDESFSLSTISGKTLSSSDPCLPMTFSSSLFIRVIYYQIEITWIKSKKPLDEFLYLWFYISAIRKFPYFVLNSLYIKLYAI